MANPLFRRPRITLVVLVLISLSLLSVSYRGTPPAIVTGKGYVRDIVTPLRQAVTAIVAPVYDVAAGAFDYGTLKRQNSKLQNEVAALRNQRIVDRGALSSLAALTAVLHISFAGNIKGIPAQVISYTPTNVQLSVELDKGSLAGVQVGNPVVSAYGLIGRVIQVSANTASVLLVDDPNFAVGVRFGTSGQIGLAVGQGAASDLTVQLVDPGTALKKGEVAFSSGLSGEIFPPDIPVGSVIDAYTPPGGLEEHVDLRPVVNLTALNYVAVMRWLPPSP